MGISYNVLFNKEDQTNYFWTLWTIFHFVLLLLFYQLYINLIKILGIKNESYAINATTQNKNNLCQNKSIPHVKEYLSDILSFA